MIRNNFEISLVQAILIVAVTLAISFITISIIFVPVVIIAQRGISYVQFVPVAILLGVISVIFKTVQTYIEHDD